MSRPRNIPMNLSYRCGTALRIAAFAVGCPIGTGGSAEGLGRLDEMTATTLPGRPGAFGAGFLLGWASVEGGNALPKFDGVSGVSAGALIAPFAFLGAQADLETIDRLFRNPKPDWVVRRGMFFFLPENASLADVS